MAIASVCDVQPRAKAALAASPFFELRDLQVEQHDDGLLLSGVVSSFYYKQLAQEIVRAVCNGIGLSNAIHVKDQQASGTKEWT